MADKKKPKVGHLGGAFIYSSKPEALANWYKEIMEMDFEHSPEYKAWYASFPYIEKETGKEAYVAWSILENVNRPKVEEKIFCINYRVVDMDDMIDHLKSKGIEVKGPEEYPEGKFAWIKDLDGNHIELWEDTNLNNKGIKKGEE